MDTTRPFRTRDARQAGAPTRGRLAGPGFRSPFRGTHVAVAAPDDLVSRAHAAALLVDDAVIGGYAAAALHGADCAPRDAPVDLVVGPRRHRPRPGLLLRQDLLRPDEIVVVDGVSVTSPLRTAYDLVRAVDFVEGVVALDALAAVGEFEPEAILEHVGGRSRPRGHRRLAPAVEAAEPGSGSPPETRLRLVLVEHGIPRPVVQCPVPGVRAAWVPHVDLGWPELKVAVEYQGDLHRTDPEQWRRDQERWAVLGAAGWLVIPATWEDLYRRPATFAARVREALEVRTAERAARSA
ncbi:hypothetical protein EV188_108250 [Actinomycetospora succinea]|uniref:DUF559 domain-containing protein n=1 Tax=Actinomycetospora succinea TaxID=663603 RepID=A0A4R6V0C2_9PSEU|nr:hypothetical protein [Actinomycetospora succinea]TDQ51889.1 hypothetical protein EV188_108250 [Actinomycetospora succinea]